MTPSGESYILDAAQAAKEVATLVALCLIQTGGNPVCAETMCEDLSELAPSLELAELDAAKIGAQAIREAVALREELRG